MSDFLPIRSELTRKVCDTLIHLQLRLDRGEIDQHAAWAAVDAIYDCVSGLLPQDVLSLVLQIRAAMKPTRPARELRVFERVTHRKTDAGAWKKLHELMIVRRELGDGVVSYLTSQLTSDFTETWNDFKDRELPSQEAKACMNRVVRTLHEKREEGWREVE